MTGIIGNYISLGLDDLILDKDNPRFQAGPTLKTQADLANKLIMAYDVYQIAKNIATNGYFAPSPMVVVRDSDSSKYVVVEGNRRLTALKALCDVEFREKLYQPELWQDLAKVSVFDPSTQLPVVLVEREQVEILLGFRHISGDLPWQPLAQARWVAKVIDELGYTFEETAKTSGKSKSDIIAMYRNQAIARQAEEHNFPASILETSFSSLALAMNSPGLRDFVDATSGSEVKIGADPIPEKNIPNLIEMLTWLYGDEDNDKEPVVPDTRQINKLGKIVQSPMGLETLRKTWNLAEADQAIKEKGIDPFVSLKNRLSSALSATKLAAEIISDYGHEPEVVELVGALREALEDLEGIASDT